VRHRAPALAHRHLRARRLENELYGPQWPARWLGRPTVAYATVYPLTTLLRILSAQILAIVLFR
jgi:hypothetical protein